MAETDGASTITPNVSTAVTYVVGAASEVETFAGQVFNPLLAYYISDPLLLTGSPVVSSVVEWSATTPAAGSTIAIETSINGGLTWDLATSGWPVPRLAAGDTTTRQVQFRVTFTRLDGADASPRMQWLELKIVLDASIDELIPIANGMITKVETISVGGRGTGTSGGGGAGMTGVGGGQSGGAASIKISGVDLSRAISRNVWQQPYIVPGGISYSEAIEAMVRDRLPGHEDFSITSVSQVTPVLVYGLQQGSDPWQDIQELAAAVGCECFFDPAGVFVFRPVPDPRMMPPVWTFDDDLNPVVVKAQRELSDEQTFNYVVVKGESTATANPVAAVAFDDDPSSPTYIYGPYGSVVEYVTMPQIITADQAQAAANAILANSLGASDTVTLTGVPMAALEPGDIVRVVSSDVHASGIYSINQITTPLSPAEAQEIVAFRQSQQL
jgi:hypothetical protein